MVYIITRWEHVKTTSGPRKMCKNFRHLSYDQLFGKASLPMGTYIFSDIDRLSAFELEISSIIYRELLEAGAVVYNDPASCLMRFELLQALHRDQINDFRVYRPQYQEWPESYPVFLRRCAFHMGLLTDLLHSREELEDALRSVVASGVPMSNIMAVEYAAEKGSDGLFRKVAVHKIGDHYFQDTAVAERSWIVKYGEKGLVEEEVFRAELEGINSVPFRESVEEVFKVANIDFGRVDIGMFQGRPQFYEINTNPTVSFKTEHWSEFMIKSREAVVRNYTAAIESIDTVSGGAKIKFQSKVLKKLRKKYRKNMRWCHRMKSWPSY